MNKRASKVEIEKYIENMGKKSDNVIMIIGIIAMTLLTIAFIFEKLYVQYE